MWLHDALPVEIADDYTDLRLCRDVYHCPPDVLDRQSYVRTQRHIMLINVENETGV